MKAQPPDQSERDRVVTDLESTLFVEAGAGSGKTRALVGRIQALVKAGVQLQHIAAITFTEKAANELRQRLRDSLERSLVSDPDPRIRLALSQLDAAPISTLHAFAQRLLLEHPVEAQLPPGVEVMDELASQVAFDSRWEDFVTELLRDPEMVAPLLVGDVLGISIRNLRSLAQQFEANWDLLAARVDNQPAPLGIDVEPLLLTINALVGGAGDCTNAADKLAHRLAEIQIHGAEIQRVARTQEGDPVDRLIDLAELLCAPTPRFATTSGDMYSRLGAKGNWPDTQQFESLKLQLFEAGRLRDTVRQDMATAVIEILASRVAAFVLDAVEHRRKQGTLCFHDMLVLARDLLRSPHTNTAATALRARYRRLLIDEFQDTDPIQVDIAVLLASTDSPGDRDWTDIEVTPGRLFFVGDPKQSIYRFRRADITTYLRAQKLLGGEAGQVRLSTNFRSTSPIIAWLNRTFDQLIQPVELSQPRYGSLHPTREVPETGPGVLILGADPHPEGTPIGRLRALEAKDVAAAVVAAVSDQWSVADQSPDGVAITRPARLGDITVLVPTRRSIQDLEQALEHAEVPYRVETSSLIYSAPEIRDLLMIARSVDDPTDELATVMALRSPAFACGDDDLYLYRQHPGASWNHQDINDTQPAGDPVIAGLRWLAKLHRERMWLAPAQILDRIISERQLLELGVCGGRHREVWRRLRAVVDQARAWTDSTHGDLRDYLRWVRQLATDSARIPESILPETDTDAIRIMTVHGAKGLEFPITIVSGLTSSLERRAPNVHVIWPPNGGVGYRVGASNTTATYDASVALEQQHDRHESLRLLYVACTRASDHLVVSTHRASPSSAETFASVLAGAGAVKNEPVLSERGSRLETASGEVPRPVLPSQESWSAERSRFLAGAQRSRSVAATALATQASMGRGRRIRGRRDGAAVGRAVHGVLQTVPLADGLGLATACAAQAMIEGLTGREAEIEALAAAALASEVVQEAALLPHWREVFAAAPVGGRVIEGYVDLLYRHSGGLVVVDYKTDTWETERDLDELFERYRIQIAAYAIALEQSVGVAVSRTVLLFLSSTGATERTVDDLDAAKAEAMVLAAE